MDRFFDFLKPKKKEFPIRKAEGSGNFITSNAIATIDFRQIDRLQDSDIASMCTVVCGSNGVQGTISHLTINQNPTKYAQSLKDYWKEPVPLVLYGGDETVGGSLEFFDEIRSALEAVGFSISSYDRGGKFYNRRGIFTKNHVLLQISSGSKKIVKELQF